MGVQDPYDEWAPDHLILDERATAFGRYVKNFVMDGFGLADGGGLTVDVGQPGASFAYVNGYELRQDGVENRALAALSTNHVFLFFTKSPDPIAGTDAIAIDLEVNTTGIPLTSDSIKLGEVDTDGGSVTAIRAENNDFRLHDAQLETDLDARQFQITELVHHKGTAFPSAPVAGQPFFRTDLGTLHIWDGGSWVTIGASGTSVNVQEDGGAVVVGATDLNFEDGIVAAAGGPGEATLNLDYGGAAELADSTAAPESAGASPKVARADHKHRVATAAPAAQVVGAGGIGASTSLAKADHVHPLASGVPAAITDGAAAEGVSTAVARRDHVHPHGGLAGGALHAVATPATAGFMSAADKTKLDGLSLEGLDVKESVRAATTGPLSIATDLEPGDVVDGVVLAPGDRVLVKDQGAAAENGIYVVPPGPGPATRATDFDAAAGVTASAFAFVEEGTDNADSGWVLVTDDPITIGVTALAFTQFTGLGQITAGDGLAKTGNTLDVGAGAGVIVNADDVEVEYGLVGELSPIEPDDAAAAGSVDKAARVDHTHAVAADAAVELTDSTNAEGASTAFSRADHTHAHGSRGGGTLHAAATGATAGFMSAADKSKLDTLDADDVADSADRTWGKFVVLQPGEHSSGFFSTAYTKAAAAIVDFDQLPTNAAKFVFRWDQTGAPGSGTAEVRLRDITNGATLGELTGISTTGLMSFVLSSVPSGVVRLEVQHRKTAIGVGDSIEGGTLTVES